jgi:hypothetical protein
MFEMPPLVELPGVSFVASLDLPIHFRAAWRYVPVRDAKIGKMPSELWCEQKAVIGLTFLNCERDMLPDFL